MSIPEIILQRAIINGLRKVRDEPRILDVLFRHLGQAQLQSVKDFILKKPIDFSINYPRADLKAPALILLLKNEQEDQTFLGDMMGVTGHFDTPDYELSYSDEDLLGGATVSQVAALGPALTGELRISSDPVEASGSNYIILREEDRDELEPLFDDASLECVELRVVRGTGAGQVFNVTKISTSRVDIDGTFATLLDTTSVVVLRDGNPPPAVDGEPSRSYSRDESLYRVGAQFNVQYQLLVLGSSQEEVIYLYTVIKAIVYLSRVYFEGQGLHNLVVSGTDFAPRSEYLPDVTYQRSMIMRFTYPFSVLEEIEQFTTLDVCLFPEDPVSQERGVPLQSIITLEP